MKTILVVDDDPDILEVVRCVLNTEGFRVAVSQRGDLVPAVLQEVVPDLILMDVMMGDTDGRHICKALKSSDQYAHIPVVLFSASLLSVDELMTCGANDFFPKPFDIDQLLGRVRQNVLA